MTVFICGEEPEEIWCAVYDAWMSRLGHKNVRIEPKGEDRELFCEYRLVEVEDWKIAKVTTAIRRKLSERLYEYVYKAALSQERYRADRIYRFLIYAFAWGNQVLDMLQIPEVHGLFEMHRHLSREYNHMMGFTRFSQMKEGILLSRINPKNDLTMLLADFFSDRMPEENWILYDVNRKKAAVHQRGSGWVMVRADSGEWKSRLECETDEKQYEDLWKTFHTSIGILERLNPRCQMNMLPLRYRPYMTEFDNKPSQ